jgi:CheY-like chemotaxis protein
MNNLSLSAQAPNLEDLSSHQPIPEKTHPEKTQYPAKLLSALLEAVQKKQVSGVLQLETTINQCVRKSQFVLEQGQFVYGGVELPTTAEIVSLLQQQVSGKWMSLAITATLEQGGYQITPHALLNRLVAMHLLTWDQISALILEQVAIALEPHLDYPGEFTLLPPVQTTLTPDFSLEQVMVVVRQRQSLWASLTQLSKGMETVPYLSKKALHVLANEQQSQAEADIVLLRQLFSWIDGQQSILEIATSQRRDPLLVARELLPAFQYGWIVTEQVDQEVARQQATILVVDDSELMRQLISRVLSDCYHVLVVGTAMEAFALLDREPIELLLLDVSMPGIDGLELCRSVRNMSKFRNLPIVMVTAKDSFFDKVKGRMAGATEYLTKPFANEQLLRRVTGYVQPVMSTLV